MRSRYSAFTEGRVDYLIKTLHPEKRRPSDFASLSESASEVRWTGLRVLEVSAGSKGDENGQVEFVAFFERAGRRGELHERSRFCRQDGAWFYLDGETPRRHRRPGRRDRCWCGSGKLYRKCHG